MNTKLPQLVMKLPAIESLPRIQLPEGYSARSHRVGEEEVWEAIISKAFERTISFADRISASSNYLPDKVQYICDSKDIPVATATAWYSPKWGASCGYLHMVGVLQEHGGKGLGASVSILALRKMEQEGRVSAVLHTDDFRLPAIRTYLKLGFLPYLDHDSHRERWVELARELNDRKLSEWVTILDNPINS